MVQNLIEDFLYERLPEGLVELDARGVIQAVVGGYQDRIEDLRSYSKKLELLFSSVGLPETGDNVVLVDITSAQGKVYTRSLDLQSDTPPDGSPALFTWVFNQLVTVSSDRMANVRYGRDLLRLVDTNTLDYLAQTIGAVLYQSSALTAPEQQTSNRQLVETYFNRLRIKGTAESFNVLGRILGFDDVMVTPLFGRLSAHRPNDIGNPANDADFKAEPDYYPQQQVDPFYDPNVTNDGPFYSWSGTVSHGTASTEFYTQVINGFNPWIEAVVLNVQSGTIVDPANGSYALGSSGTLSEGGPHKKAFVEPAGATIMFRAIAEGESFNGIEVNVADSGTNKLITVSDRLSSVKYRSSYFDLALTAEFDRVEELYGDRAVRRNKDLAANPELTSDGTALSPYRPWSAGSISTGSNPHDFLIETGTHSPVVIQARVQAAGTNRELNLQSFTAAGVQVTQALEEVRAATRLPRRASAGFLIRDDVGYAAYEKETLLFTTNGSQNSYVGTNTYAPAAPYIAEIALEVGTIRSYVTAAERPTNSNVYDYKAQGFNGSFNFQVGTWAFVVSPASAGTEVFALWKPTSTEVVRTEPLPVTEKAYQARPEDQENGQIDEVADDIPWARELVVGGEQVDPTMYNPLVPDVTHELAEDVMSVPAQTGAEYNVYGIDSLSGHLRFTFGQRTIGEDYKHGQPAIGYQGTLKDLAAIVPTPGQTELETFFQPGAKLFTLGLVQGVLVADPNQFFSAAHRDNLVGWFPLNEHVDDNLPVVDHSSRASNLSTIAVSATDRLWSDSLGWYLALPPSALLVGDKVRFDGEDFTVSFWLNGDDISGTGTSTIFEYGPVSFRLDAANKELSAYVRNTEGNLVLIGRLFPNGWSFVTLRMSATEAVMGIGSAAISVNEVVVSGLFAAFSDVSSLVLRGCGSVAMGLRDLRLWSQKKTYDELDQIRDYQPTETQTGWQIGSFLTLNRRDRYGVKILSNGLGEPAVLPAWYRVPRLAWVTRYSSLGLYSGEDRFNEVGLGSGPQLPAQYKLGQQFYNLAAVGQTVVSTQHGVMPGINAQWLNTSVPPTFLRVVHTTLSSFDSYVSTGTSTPWPNAMIETNPDREEIWVKGDNGYMYKVSLESQGTASAQLVAEFIARERTDAELLLGGTANWSTLRYSEQPTGAQVILSGTLNSKILLVQGGTVVALAPYSGTVNTPPIYLYLNSRTDADVRNAWDAWTDRFDDNFGNDQVPPVPALNANGVLEFDNTGTLAPGNYKLTVVSGNIGKADEDFDGFAVEISVDATVMQRRLCEGLHGFNFQGTDTFEFPVENGVSGAWQLSFDWTNHFADPNRGEARQLAIRSYKLERLTTELYKVSIPASGTTPALTKLQTLTFDGTTPGGWIAALNSYGSIASYQHEANVYPSADTLTSKYPLSHLLTGSTEARREDVLGPLTVVLVDGVVPSMPSFGTIANAATGMVPMYIWSGGITPDSVTIAARMPADSTAVQAVVSETGTLGNPIWSDFAIANVDNSNVAKMTVTGLQPNKHYYYAIATAGSIADGYIGEFNTWDETKLNFQFALASCSNNTIVTGVNPVVFDTIRNKAPLFFLHTGDLHYNDGANEPTTLAQYQNCYDQIFIKSARQKQFWQELAVIYIWDDHDYGPNNSYGDYANKTMARLGYQRGTPHYPLGAGSGDIPIYYTFSVGRCFFIVTDLRSACDPASKTDSALKTRMGAQQKAWWKAQVLAAKDIYPVIFWVSTVPWGGAASAGADGWAGFSFERRELVDFVVANNVKGIFVLAGDMHACAADNGNNEKWGTGTTGGFVVFQAAPLHQNASQKGTPYSTGPFPPSGSALKNQYGLITVTDQGGTNTPNVRFQAFDDTSSLDAQIIDVNFYGTHSPVP